MCKTRFCVDCTHCKVIKGSDAVRCSVTDRTMLVNRANDCDEYSDKYEVRKIKEKGCDI